MTAGTVTRVTVDGVAVTAGCHGPEGAPTVVLVHGGGAHGGWWDEVAIDLAADRRVVVPDLSGHGGSRWRPVYGFDVWADEVVALARAGGGTTAGPPVVAGHSMGGLVALRAGARHRLRGAVVVDSAIRHHTEAELAPFLSKAQDPPREFADRGEAVRRFRLRPEAPLAPQEVLARLAESSVHRRGAGWVRSVDPRTFPGGIMAPAEVRPLRCPLAVVRGEFGHMGVDICDDVRSRSGRDPEMHVVAGAGHHVMLDRPAATADALRAVLRRWTEEE